MTAAEQIAELAAWLAASSTDDESPMGQTIKRGPYAELVSVGMDDPVPDLAAEIALGCLLLLTAAAVPAPTFAEPVNQQALLDRARHVIWKAAQAPRQPEGFPACAVVAVEAGQTLREACTAAGVDPDADRAVIGLPLAFFAVLTAMKLRHSLPVR